MRKTHKQDVKYALRRKRLRKSDLVGLYYPKTGEMKVFRLPKEKEGLKAFKKAGWKKLSEMM
jgi:hypothetical protein